MPSLFNFHLYKLNKLWANQRIILLTKQIRPKLAQIGGARDAIWHFWSLFLRWN